MSDEKGKRRPNPVDYEHALTKTSDTIDVNPVCLQIVVVNNTAVDLFIGTRDDVTATYKFKVPAGKVFVSPRTTFTKIKYQYASAPGSIPAYLFAYPRAIFTPSLTS